MESEKEFSKHDLVYTSCPLCGANEFRTELASGQLRLVKCNKCGFVYLNPRLKTPTLMKLYNEGAFSSPDYYAETSEADKRSFEDRLAMIESFTNKGKILDAGCSVGSFLEIAKNRGWKVTGFDINRKAITECRRKGIDAVCTTLEETNFPPNYFDAISMNDFIEHVPDPLATLKGANRLLKNDGILFISTPKINSLLYRIFRKRWIHLKPWQHLSFFTPITINKILRKAGFKVVRCFTLGRHRSVKILINKSEAYVGKILRKVLWRIAPKSIRDRTIYFDPGDEMGIIAIKTNQSRQRNRTDQVGSGGMHRPQKTLKRKPNLKA
ncbi:MAG: methyltransferase domain-containing protein [Candidatus Micrarchaeota archaeon]